jgi:hypothetical protein
VKGVRYRADAMLNERMRKGVEFERNKRLAGHSAKHTPEGVRNMMLQRVEEQGFITTQGLVELCFLIPSTARRYLARWCKEGILYNAATRHAPVYKRVAVVPAEGEGA